VLLGVDVDVAITIGISHNLLIVKFLLFSDVVVMHVVIVDIIVAMLTCAIAAVLRYFYVVVLPNLCFLSFAAMNTIPSVKGRTMSTSRMLYPTKVNMICIITFVILMGTTGYVEMICHCSNL